MESHLRQAAIRCAALLLFSSLFVAAHAATPLAPEAQGRIRAATFEVVMSKPTGDSLTYEKPLPLDLIPYQERTDKYRSIGTAFAIGKGRYVSAAHVLNAGFGSQYGEPALRDAQGKVYAIDHIHKYSGHEDFVVFSVKDLAETAVFEINEKPQINETVYAVGNAHGEGVVIRDGLFTSETPEEENGRWKWLRFSAAASPGNSGGPLLDKDSRVIGVVLRKSANENLNYALSIAQVLNAKDDYGSIDDQMQYFLPNTKITETQRIKGEFKLPLSYTQFEKEVMAFNDSSSEKLLKELLAKNRDKFFPRSAGSVELLHNVYSTTFPYLVAEKPDNTWDAFQPQDIANSDLDKNGFLSYGVLGGYSMIRLRKPDDVSLQTLYGDPKLYMDWLMKSVPVNRSVGRENVRVTSLGKPFQEATHTDSFARKWQVRRWKMEYADAVVISYALPTPEGYAALVRTVPTGLVNNVELDMKTLTDFIYISYGGTLAQWKEFLALKPVHPAAFNNIQIAFDYSKQFNYRSPRVVMEYTPQLQKIEADSYLMLSFAYFREKDATVWDVGAISLLENVHGENMFTLQRRQKPAASLSDAVKSDWDKLVGGRYPYDSSPVFKEGTTTINSLYHPPGVAVQPVKDSSNVIYAVSYVAEGEQGKEKMGDSLNAVLKGMQVRE